MTESRVLIWLITL